MADKPGEMITAFSLAAGALEALEPADRQRVIAALVALWPVDVDLPATGPDSRKDDE